MKQHISLEQLNELSEKGKEKLGIWTKSYYEKHSEHEATTFSAEEFMGIKPFLRQLSIGQLIEFLDEHNIANDMWFNDKEWHIGTVGICDIDNEYNHSHAELCDALWEAVKEILNHE